MDAFAERRWTSKDGLSLYARDYAGADGPPRLPVICLHGLTRNSRDFEEAAPWIAGLGRRVIVPDVRGRGESDRDPHPLNYVPKTYVRDVLGMLDAFGIRRAIFVGTSMGGIITLMLAGARRSAVAGAILNDVGPEVSPAGINRLLTYVGQAPSVTSWAEAADYSRQINELAFPGHDDDEWARFARRTFRDDGGTPELDYDPAIMVPFAQGRYKSPKWLAWLLFRRLVKTAPTLLVRGATSDILSAEIAEKMKASAPALQTVVVPGIGHAPMLTEPASMAAIEGFLRELA